MTKPWAALGMLVGLAGVLLQAWLSIPAYLAEGEPIWNALIKFFSYFTIQTNIILVLIYATELFNPPWLSLLAKPPARVMAAALITLVMLFYHFILASTWQPEGMWKVADTILHYVTPLLYLFWFAVLRYSKEVSLSAIPVMLIYPVVYVAYILLRGALTADYPYAIFDAHESGYATVAINSAVLLAVVIVLMVVAIAVDRISPQTAEAA